VEGERVSVSVIPLFEERSASWAAQAARRILEEMLSKMPQKEQARLRGAEGQVAATISQLVRRDVVGFNVVYDQMTDEHYVVFTDQDMRVLSEPRSYERFDSQAAELLFQVLAAELHHAPGVGHSAMLVARRPVAGVSGQTGITQVRWNIMRLLTQRGSGFSISMRKQALRHFLTLLDLYRQGTVDDDAMKVIQEILSSDVVPSIFVLGAPAAGKTTMLNAMLLDLYRRGLRDKIVVAVGEASDFVAPPEIRGPDGRPRPAAALMIFLPGQAEWQAIGDAIRRSNAMFAIIGEITTETAHLVVLAMQAFAAVFGTMHATTEGFPFALWRELGMREGYPSSFVEMLRPSYLFEMQIRVASDGAILRRLERITRLESGRMETIYRAPSSPAARR